MAHKFNATIIHEQNKYFVELPWKVPKPHLEDNLKLAKGHLYKNYTKLKNAGKLGQYNSVLEEQLSMGFIEEVKNEPFKKEGCHYLTHRAVYRDDSATTKLRIVYNCSLKGPNSISLNDCLIQGPNLVSDLVKILLNFRLDKYAIQSDIAKAFLKIQLKLDTDKDHLRFLWFKDPNDINKGFMTYRFNCVMFGATSSPSLLSLTIANHLNRYSNTLTIEFLKKCLYVDNLIGSTATEEEILEIYNRSQTIMNEGNFQLREWQSNSTKLNAKIKKDGLGLKEKSCFQKTLGMNWYLDDKAEQNDSVCLKSFTLDKEANTKKKILSEAAKIFDPLGIFSPATIRARFLMQELWVKQYGWDDVLPEEHVKQWKNLATDLNKLQHIKIPRCAGFRLKEQSLHIFADASTQAYGCVAYLVSETDSNLVFAKTKVTPIKIKRTIPQLELLAFTIGLKTAKFLLNSYTDLDIKNIHIWSDSQVTLARVMGTKSHACKNIFVKNRLLEIEDVCDSLSANIKVRFNYVETKENPADFLTRGLSYKLLKTNKNWFNGPKWLLDKNSLSNLVVNNTQLAKKENKTKEPLFQITDKMDFTRIRNITALCYKFIDKHVLNKERQESELNLEATKYWVRQAQKTDLQNEYEFLTETNNKTGVIPSLITDLNLYMDKEGIIRCRGRLNKSNLTYNAKHPILLPRNSHLTNLIIRNIHDDKVYHMGVTNTLAEIRKTYWIPKGRSMVKSIVDPCITCKRINAHSFKTPSPPDLPKERVTLTRPFEATGVDYTGDVTVSYGNDNSKKVYIVLFTCAASRAIALDLVDDLTAESFIAALRRFSANYGTPKKVSSDNASYFKAADGEIKNIFEDEKVKKYFGEQFINWSNIPAKSPWYGSIWERNIQTVKNCLRKSVGNRHVHLFELMTISAEVQNIVNSDDINELEVLTPNLLLKGESPNFIPELEAEASDDVDWRPHDHKEINLKFKNRSKIKNEFIKRWESEYLTSLREQHKKLNNLDWENSIKLNDIVLIQSELPRLQWPLGRVIELLPGDDGVVREVKLKTKNGITTRAIDLLYPLECSLKENLSDETNVSPDNSNVNSDVPINDVVISNSRPKRKAAEKFERLMQTKIQAGQL